MLSPCLTDCRREASPLARRRMDHGKNHDISLIPSAGAGHRPQSENNATRGHAAREPHHAPQAAAIPGPVRHSWSDNRENRANPNVWATTSMTYGAQAWDPDVGPGSRPNFSLGERRRKVPSAPAQELTTSGFERWFATPPDLGPRGRRHLNLSSSGYICEPHVLPQHTRGGTLDPYVYRRTAMAGEDWVPPSNIPHIVSATSSETAPQNVYLHPIRALIRSPRPVCAPQR